MQKYVIVASHRRSGTHWLIDSIFNNIKGIDHGYLNLDRLLPSHPECLSIDHFWGRVNRGRGSIILKTHTLGTYETFENFPTQFQLLRQEILPRSQTVYVVRDGRDVMVSLYHYLMKNSRPQPRGFVNFLYSMNSFDHIRESETRSQFYASHVRSWLEMRSKIIVKYEELHTSYDGAVSRIAEWVGADLRGGIKKIEIKKYNRLQRGVRRLLPKLFSSTAVLPRKGIVGEWREVFDQEAKALFKAHAGDVLCELGYEKGFEW